MSHDPAGLLASTRPRRPADAQPTRGAPLGGIDISQRPVLGLSRSEQAAAWTDAQRTLAR